MSKYKPKKLTPQDVDGWTWGDIVRHYVPDISDDGIEFILWEKTCYPMSTEKTIEQLNELFKAE